MTNKKDEPASATVWLENDIINTRVVGRINLEQLKAMNNEVARLCKKLQSEGKKVVELSDITRAKVSDSQVRVASKKTMNPDIEAVAVYGSGFIAPIAMYLMRSMGGSKSMRYFRSRLDAVAWLKGSAMPRPGGRQRKDYTGLVAACLLGLIGSLSLLGWATDNHYLVEVFSQLRPINPMAAVGLLILAIGLAAQWAKQPILIRVVAVLAILLGAAALAPGGFVDTLLFNGPQIDLSANHYSISDTAAVAFIAAGLGLFAAALQMRHVDNSRQKIWWRAAIVAGAAVFAVGFLIFLGFLYSVQALYDISPNFTMPLQLAIAFVIFATSLLLMIIWQRPAERLQSISRTSLVVVLVLVIVQGATVVLWHFSRAQSDNNAQRSFQSASNDAQRALSDRIQAYVDVLYGFRGLFHSSEAVSQGEFIGYYNALHVAQQYPGFWALSFIKNVSQGQEAAFQAAVRADNSYAPAGRPQFQLSNLAPTGDHYVAEFSVRANTPPSTTGGLDLASNQTRKTAYDKARDSGEVVTLNAVQILQPNGQPGARKGFILAIPVYEDSIPKDSAVRRQQFEGIMNAVFYYDDMLKEVFGTSQERGLAITLQAQDENGNDVEFYRTGNVDIFKQPAHERLQQVERLRVGDSDWQMTTAAPTNYLVPASSRYLPYIIVLTGNLLSLLLIFAFWNLSQLRRQALHLAEAMTEDLQNERNEAIATRSKDEAILSSIGDGVFALNMKGEIILFNKAAAFIGGVDTRSVLGKPYESVLQFVTEEDRKPADHFVKKAMGGKKASMQTKTMLVRHDGIEVPVADSAAPILDAHGKQIGIIVVFRDVSEERKIERAKDEFVSLTSHQLRTPLTAIRLFIEMLLKGQVGKLTPEQRDYLEKVDISTKRMVRLVGDFLNISRIELGRFKVEPSSTDLPALVQSHVVELEAVAMRKGISIEFEPAKHKIPPLPIDQNLYGQVVHNLLTNAIRYSPIKTGKIKVSIKKTTDEVELVVADNGIGIPKDAQPKVFARFYRAPNAVHVETEGSGLGLYLVKQILDTVDGRISFESTEGKGTTFHAIIPATGMKAKAGEVSLTKTGNDL